MSCIIFLVSYFCCTLCIISLPGMYDYLCLLDEQSINQLQFMYSSIPSINTDNFRELADALVLHYQVPLSTDFNNCLQLYFSLIFVIKCLVD